MLPIILGIASALSAAPELFAKGKQLYEAVTGTPSSATTPDQLKDEIAKLPEEQQIDWAERTRVEIDRFRAESARLLSEQGDVSVETLRVLDPKVANKIAWLRMATRPRIVLMLTHAILIPFYIMIVDGFLLLIQNLCSLFGYIVGFSMLADTLFSAGLPYKDMYTWLATTAAGIIGTYMIVRGVEKAKGVPDSTPVAITAPAVSTRVGQALDAASGVADRIRQMIKTT